MSQFGLLDQMQTDFGTAPVRIMGVNGAGSESNNAAACEGKDIPWLQDTSEEQVWSLWNVTYRDVWILDENNVPVAVYNLTDHDLNNPANYAELMAIIQAHLPP